MCVAYGAADIIESYQDAVGGYVFVPAGIILALQGCMGFALVFTYPILAFELRHSADSMLFGHKEFSWIRHTGVNVAVVSISLLVAILVPSLVRNSPRKLPGKPGGRIG